MAFAALLDVVASLMRAWLTGDAAVAYAPLAVLVTLSLVLIGIQGKRWPIFIFIVLSIATRVLKCLLRKGHES